MREEDKIAIDQLEQIKSLALRNYPYPDTSHTDPNLLLTLGEIAGIAEREILRMKN